MSILFKNVYLPESCGYGHKTVNILIEDDRIVYIGEKLPKIFALRTIEGNGNLVIPAFYNAHCHSAMTLFRGYGDDLPLGRWLDEKILPAEEKLDSERVYYGSMLAIAEMLRGGVVSFSDMYYFLDDTARAISESGVKANISRSIVSFDKDIDVANDYRIAEAIELYKKWHNADNGRIKVEMSLHAEYTNVEKCCRYVAFLAREMGTGIHIHASETASEHEKCIERHGVTPIKFFEDTGVLDVPVTAAHCVWVEDNDIQIIKNHNVTVVHNPVSNLKLGSGIMPYRKLREAGINIALGTDGAASNNSISILRELQFASLIHKGEELDPTVTNAGDMLEMATRNGALAQGREDCGKIEVGAKADLLLVDMDSIGNIPSYNFESTICYSASEADILMTVCDGRILYERGTYTSIDEERLRYEAKRVISHYFD